MGPKVYAGITLDGQDVFKIKGLSHNKLPSFDELELLLNKNSFLMINQFKNYNDLSNATIVNKETIYTLRVTSNKRDLVFNNNVLVNTKNKIIS